MIAALTTPPPAESPPLRDIAPAFDVFPYPTWMLVIAGIVVLSMIGGFIYVIFHVLGNRIAPPPPSPRNIALRELEALRALVRSSEPYAFSIAVSDVLRRYVSAQFRVRATQQTSPEFLAAIAESVKFGDADRRLLAEFLERCDLIKFAHIDADAADNERLLASAIAFVQGGAVA